jgi:hypothetical protein
MSLQEFESQLSAYVERVTQQEKELEGERSKLVRAKRAWRQQALSFGETQFKNGKVEGQGDALSNSVLLRRQEEMLADLRLAVQVAQAVARQNLPTLSLHDFDPEDGHIGVANSSELPLSLGGFSLTFKLPSNKTAEPARFAFSADVVLPPHGSLSVWLGEDKGNLEHPDEHSLLWKGCSPKTLSVDDVVELVRAKDGGSVTVHAVGSNQGPTRLAESTGTARPTKRAADDDQSAGPPSKKHAREAGAGAGAGIELSPGSLLRPRLVPSRCLGPIRLVSCQFQTQTQSSPAPSSSLLVKLENRSAKPVEISSLSGWSVVLRGVSAPIARQGGGDVRVVVPLAAAAQPPISPKGNASFTLSVPPASAPAPGTALLFSSALLLDGKQTALSVLRDVPVTSAPAASSVSSSAAGAGAGGCCVQ